MIIDRINSSIGVIQQIISNEDLILQKEKVKIIANELNMFCILEIGNNCRKMNDLSVILQYIPSNNKPGIRLTPITIEPIICEIVEQSLFNHV